jgi:hypothetical protein
MSRVAPVHRGPSESPALAHLPVEVEELDALALAAEELRDRSRDLDHVLVDCPRFPNVMRLRTGEAAADILRFLVIFREAQSLASEEAAADIGQHHELFTLFASGRVPAPGLPRESERLIMAYKALYYFIRAYQDRLYAVLAILLEPDAPSGRSMNAAFKNSQNPARRLLDTHLPEYVEWFPNWRDQRNKVKDGISFSTAGPAPQTGLTSLGIRFNEFSRDGGVSVDCSEAVQLADVTRALRLSAALAAIAAALGS